MSKKTTKENPVGSHSVDTTLINRARGLYEILVLDGTVLSDHLKKKGAKKVLNEVYRDLDVWLLDGKNINTNIPNSEFIHKMALRCHDKVKFFVSSEKDEELCAEAGKLLLKLKSWIHHSSKHMNGTANKSSRKRGVVSPYQTELFQ